MDGTYRWSSAYVPQASGLRKGQAGGLSYGAGDSNATTASGGSVMEMLW